MDPVLGPASRQQQMLVPEKSTSLYIREFPHRAIAIVSSAQTLIFRYSPTTNEAIVNGTLASVYSSRARSSAADHNVVSKCIVELTETSDHILRDYRPLTPRPIFGTLGLIAVSGDVFLSVVTHATRAATIRTGETVERIASVAFFCLNTAEYDDIVSTDIPENDFSDATSVYSQNLSRREQTVEHPCQELRKLLSNGTFYYSTDFDVTNRLQDRPVNATSFNIDNFDESFLWNSFMIKPLVEFRSRLMPQKRDWLDQSRILTSAIRGFCGTMTIPQASAPLRAKASGLPSYLTVISRLSCRRAGTRFNSRGIDDDGNVANFVETETTYWSPSGSLFSYAQVRGSVPVFWEQAADLMPGRQKITITRSADGTQPAFNKHFEDLEHAYGAVHVVNLLSDAKPGEAELTQYYRYGINHCPLSRSRGGRSLDHALLRSTEYDFHAETKAIGYEAAKGIRRYIEDAAEGFAYFLAQEADDVGEHDGELNGSMRFVTVLQQDGVFRTNCLDCLDRTNLIQTLISQMAIEAFLSHRGEHATADFLMRHSSLWADNGDSLSKTYAGTGALKTSFTRHGKMSLSGAMADLRKSAQRLYHNNFTDPSRQITIDMLLGRLVGQHPVHLYDPISDFVSAELSKRGAEFSSSRPITMWVGTFNLNGRTDGLDQDLSPWLCPDFLGSTQPEIVVVGFQEIVELSPQQIMNSDPTRKDLWERAVKRTLNHQADRLGGERYILLRSGQLVGAALCIFVKASELRNIKNVEGSVKKTGMSGMAGNKGAVAIRLDYANTPICFVTAHLAAGFSNYDERNRDYATIHHGLRFQRNRGIDDHDTVVWLGDFNYRIGLNSDVARALVKKGDLETLYENDQLNLQMVAGLAFPFYSEARIAFPPTYKFDIGSDEYDTSEKARIPAWTDRVLRKGSNLRQLSYNSAPLKFSDHRPVYAVFQCVVNIVNEALRQSISEELYERRKADVGDLTTNMDTDETDDEEFIGYDAVEPGLPPASSDHQKWWLENGQPARADLMRPKGKDGQGTVLNPSRPSNPFTPNEEPDWVAVPRSSSRQSLSSISSSPYEFVTIPAMLSTSATSTTPRRLPPPYTSTSPPAALGRLSLNGEGSTRQTRKQAAPTPPPPRRQTGATTAPHQIPTPVFSESQTASTGPPRWEASASETVRESKTGKSPPPVAKKPPHLTSLSPSSSPPLGSPKNRLNIGAGGSRPPFPARASSGPDQRPSLAASIKKKRPAAPPRVSQPELGRRSVVANPTLPAGSAVVSGMTRKTSTRSEGHSRPQVPAKIQKRAPVDLLGSIGADGHPNVGKWETLQPNVT